MAGEHEPDGTTNDLSPRWLNRAILLGMGAADTRKHSSGDYATTSIEDIIGMAANPAAVAKDMAPYIVPSSYIKGGGEDDARSHSAQRRHGSFPLICVDVDKGNHEKNDLDSVIVTFFGEVFAIFYSTASATEDDKRWRIIMPLRDPLAFPQWIELMEAFAEFMAEHGVMVDRKLLGPAQLVYLPNVPPGRRYEDGEPIFYDFGLADGPPASPEAPEAAKAIKALQERRAVDERLKAFARAEAASRRAERIASGQESVIDAYNARNRIEELLIDYDYEQSPRSDVDWRSPHQTSGSYATRVFECDDGSEHWVSLSESDSEAGLGAKSVDSAQFGDAFDLFAHYAHDGDVSAALSAASTMIEIVPNAPAGPVPSDDEEPLPQFPAPFPGVMEQTAQTALETAYKPQPSLTTLAVLIAMASACDGHYMLPSGMRFNLYGLAVAPTGAGKDHAQHAAKKLAQAAGVTRIGEAGSGQGLEDSLVSYHGTLTSIDEIAHTLAATSDSKAPPHLKAAESMFLKLFTASRGSYTTRLLAGKSSRLIEHPCLSLVGFATPEMLGKALGEGDIASGLLGRMLIAVADDGVRPRRGAKAFDLPEDVRARAVAISNRDVLASSHGPDYTIAVVIEAGADARLDELLATFDAEMEASPPEGERALRARSYEKAERIAGVLAIWDNPTQPSISLAHVEWAEAFVRACDAAMLWFVRKHMHGGQVQADAAKVMRIVKKVRKGEYSSDRPSEWKAIRAGYAPRALVLRKCKMDAKPFNLAVEQLVAQGDLLVTTYAPDGAGKGIAVFAFPAHD